jgi:hypothetical protein
MGDDDGHAIDVKFVEVGVCEWREGLKHDHKGGAVGREAVRPEVFAQDQLTYGLNVSQPEVGLCI